MLTARRNSDDAFYKQKSTTIHQRAQSVKEHKEKSDSYSNQNHEKNAKNWNGKLKSSMETLFFREKKPKPFRTSHSCDVEHIDTSNVSRSNVEQQSDRSDVHNRLSISYDDTMDETRFELERSCCHCSLMAQYRARLLKDKMTNENDLLAQRLGSARRAMLPLFTTPNIIVSSISSDEDDPTVPARLVINENDSSLQTSGASTESNSAISSPHFDQYDHNFGSFESQVTSSNSIHRGILMSNALLSPCFINSLSSLRSKSFDISTLRRDDELFSITSDDSKSDSESVLQQSSSEIIRTKRSKSHDPSTTTDLLRRHSRTEYLTLFFRKALAKSPVVRRSAVEQEARTISKHSNSRYWYDEQIHPAEHIWMPSSRPGSSTSVDSECYLGDKDCRKMGEKRQCAACHMVAHTLCFSLLVKLNFNCKTTFQDHSMKKQLSREMIDSLSMHHWVHKWRHEGRCTKCGKSFQQKIFNFQQKEKETMAVVCSWCKESYHLKNCFSGGKLEERCNRGQLKDVIVPPNWIFRLPCRHRNKQLPNRRSRKLTRQYVVKPNDLSIGPSRPLIVFVNPKSGGNKGTKILHTMCWLLNPRQVFDITSLKGPKYGLEMYRKVANQLKLLVCGGDGTVGWVLQSLDILGWPKYPPMAIMPLGTGNDLSRWQIHVKPNLSFLEATDELHDVVQSTLPLTVMNNYFSIGADAHVALQFHHSRSANPQMLNSRLKNRIAYGGLGTIDLFKRTWKDLSDYIYLECDGVDITPRIKELKLHCILFHNITYYAGGTVPWGSESVAGDGAKPSCCDGKIEVLGLTTATLAALQMGGKGERLAQCSEVHVTTYKAIPMQVDGEPCLLAASHIHLTFHSKVPMLRREKKLASTANLIRRYTRHDRRNSHHRPASVIAQVPVVVVGRQDYDTYKDTIDRLKETAFEIGVVNLDPECDLNVARVLIQNLLENHPCLPYEPSKDWRFLDYVMNAEEGTFRVPRTQEDVHSVCDISDSDDCILILDDAFLSITLGSAAIQSDLSFSPSVTEQDFMVEQQRMRDTLRIVLNSDTQETHL